MVSEFYRECPEEKISPQKLKTNIAATVPKINRHHIYLSGVVDIALCE